LVNGHALTGLDFLEHCLCCLLSSPRNFGHGAKSTRTCKIEEVKKEEFIVNGILVDE
jgi:hypothetical protein